MGFPRGRMFPATPLATKNGPPPSPRVFSDFPQNKLNPRLAECRKDKMHLASPPSWSFSKSLTRGSRNLEGRSQQGGGWDAGEPSPRIRAPTCPPRPGAGSRGSLPSRLASEARMTGGGDPPSAPPRRGDGVAPPRPFEAAPCCPPSQSQRQAPAHKNVRDLPPPPPPRRRAAVAAEAAPRILESGARVTPPRPGRTPIGGRRDPAGGRSPSTPRASGASSPPRPRDGRGLQSRGRGAAGRGGPPPSLDSERRTRGVSPHREGAARGGGSSSSNRARVTLAPRDEEPRSIGSGASWLALRSRNSHLTPTGHPFVRL